MVDAVLAAADRDLDEVSFYGLWYWLGEADKILCRVAAKEDAQAAERKEEINEAVAKLRRAMGARTREHSAEAPQLTKGEKPLAEKFLQQQLSKLQAASSEDPRMKASSEKMSRILDIVRNAPGLPVSKFVRRAEEESKRFEVEWKEVSPLYDKWEAGRHSFKTNADLQAFTRRYKECEKGRNAAPEKLREMLCLRNDGKGDPGAEKNKVAPGWERPQPSKAKAAPKSRFEGSDRRGVTPAEAKPNRWGDGMMSFAQKMRSEISAQVRDEAEAEQVARREEEEEEEDEEDEEDGDEEEQEVPPQPARQAPKAPPVPKMPPPLPPAVAASSKKSAAPLPPPHRPKADSEDDEDFEQMAAAPAAPKKTSATASAKKKGKAGKRKGKGGRGDDDDDDDEVPPPKAAAAPKGPPPASAWAAGCEQALSGSVLQELFSSEAWSSLGDEAAEERLDDLTQRFAWSCPLGLALPLEWKQFAGMELDFGPKRTSKRGPSPEMLRLQKNIPTLLGHYITIVFFLTLMHSFSHFAIQFWVALLQGVLLLVPRDQPQPSVPTRVLAMQAVHLVLWLLFARSLWLMHVFVKIFVMMLVAGHAYAVAPIDEE